jgi:hypothetical protein
MQVIFCSNPMSRHLPDEQYLAESEALRVLGIKQSLVNFEALLEDDTAGGIARIVACPDRNELALYRGWMLTPGQYERLYSALASRGLTLINEPANYKYCHYLPEWYPALKHCTPKTIWIDKNELSGDFIDLLMTNLSLFASKPIIVKDYVKSEKHRWREACFIPHASNRDEVARVVTKFLQLRGSNLEGGLVFREFVEFKSLAIHSKSAMPLTLEYRLVVRNGKIVHWFNYWEEGSYEGMVPPIERFAEIATLPKSNFFTMDIAQTITGEWLVVELGDAQVAGLPENIAAIDFYSNILSKEISELV